MRKSNKKWEKPYKNFVFDLVVFVKSIKSCLYIIIDLYLNRTKKEKKNIHNP